MSDILQKSLASLPGLIGISLGGSSSDGNLSTGLQMFVHSVIALKSKQVEDEVIQRELTLQKQRLSLPSLSTTQKRDSLLRLMLCHMLGYDVSFAYIHAVKLAQQGTILEKRVGYLACSVFMQDSHELAMLLVNTIHKDLNTTNILEVCTALNAACQLVGAEMIPALLPPVCDKLNHAKEIIRRKTVLCLRAFLRKVPDLASQLHQLIRRSLSDQDPGVVWAAVEVYHQIAVIDVESCRDVVPAVVDVLSQVTSRRLPTLFDYHTVPSPWLTISLLKLLALLAANDQSASSLAYPVLGDILQRTEPSHKAGLAVIYETLVTIAAIQPNASLLSVATKCIGRFLSSKIVNLKYIGIKVLARLVQVDARYALEHQSIVIECLEHTDPTIQSKTLELLYHMANKVNKQAICSCFLDHLSRTVDDGLRTSIVSKVANIIDRLSDTSEWYIEKMTDLLLMHGDLVPSCYVHRLINVIRHGVSSPGASRDSHECQVRAVEMYWHSLKSSQTLNESLLRVAVWTVGEYGQLSKQLACDTVAFCLCTWFSRSSSNVTKQWIISALIKLLPSLSNLASILDVISRHCDLDDKELSQRLIELRVLGSSLLKDKVLHSSCPLISQMDFTLSFLDSYVCDALEAGAQPYRMRGVQSDKIEEFRDSSYSSIVFAPFEALSAPSDSHNSLVSHSAASVESSGGSAGRNIVDSVQPKGVKQIWGREGVLVTAHAEENTILQSSELLKEGTNHLVDTSDTVKDMEKNKTRQTLARALFSGIESSTTTTSSELPSTTSTGGKQSPETEHQAQAEHSDTSSSVEQTHSRSMTPDSIESGGAEVEDLSFVRESPLILHSADGVPSFRSKLHTDVSAHNHVKRQNCDKLTSSLPSHWTVNGFKDSAPDLTVNDGLSLSALVDIGCSLDSKQMSKSAEIIGRTANATDVCGSQGLEDGGVLELRSSSEDNAEDDAECLRSSGDISQPSTSDKQLLFSCEQLSVFYSKFPEGNRLAVLLEFKRLIDVDTDIFSEATLSVIAEDSFVIQLCDGETVVSKKLISLGFLTASSLEQISLAVYPTSISGIVGTVVLQLSLQKARTDVVDMHIALSAIDFVQPYPLEEVAFAHLWSSCEEEEVRVASCAAIEGITGVIELLKTKCSLHVVRIVENEALLSGCVLNQKQECVLMHCKQSTGDRIQDTRQSVSVWAKSHNKDFVIRFLTEIAAVLECCDML